VPNVELSRARKRHPAALVRAELNDKLGCTMRASRICLPLADSLR